MNRGDLGLTPGGEWHDHGHEGDEPVVWLGVLDPPLFVTLEGSYAEAAPIRAQRNRREAGRVEYLAAGLKPSKRGTAARWYPLMRFPRDRTEAALSDIAKWTEGAVELE